MLFSLSVYIVVFECWFDLLFVSVAYAIGLRFFVVGCLPDCSTRLVFICFL